MESSDYDLDINPEQLCRLCLDQEQPLKTVYCSEIIDGKIVNLPICIASVLDIKIDRDDQFPDKICTACRKKIQEFYIFKCKTKKNEELLKKLFARDDVQEELTVPHEEQDLEEVIAYQIIKHETPDTHYVQEIQMEREDVEQLGHTEKFSVECSECGEIFSSNEDYAEHKINCSVLIQCYYCSDTFTNDAEVKEHMDEAHKNDIPEDSKIQFVNEPNDQDVEMPNEEEKQNRSLGNQKLNCYLCQLKFHDSDQFRHHEDFHLKTFAQVISSIPMYKCAICCCIFLDYDDFQEHVQLKCTNKLVNQENIFYSDTKYLDSYDVDDDVAPLNKIVSVQRQDNGVVQCEYCNFSCLDLPLLLDHTKESHGDSAEIDETPHQCGICMDAFPNQRSLRQHIYLDHCKSFECFISNCDRSYQTYSKLFQHQLRCHSEDHAMECIHCYAIFLSNADLAAHIRNECPERKYKCTMCEKKFLTIQTRKQHELIHRQIKEYKCDQCTKSYATRIELIVHIRLHTGEKPYSCSLCTKTFRTLSNKRDHMSTHYSERNYKCEICDTYFKSERTLKGHSKIHIDDKGFKCPDCGKQFRRKQHLVAHLNVHLK